MDIQNLVIIAHLSIIFSLATAQKQCFPPKELAPLEWDFSSVPDDGFYFPMNSISNRNMFKDMIIGKRVTADDDLNKLSLRLQWNQTDARIFAYGNQYAHVECTPTSETDKWILNCRYQSELSSISQKEDYSHTLYGTKSDKRNYAFIYMCWADGSTNWVVLSKTPKLDDDVSALLLEHIKSFDGFEIADIFTQKYEKCV